MYLQVPQISISPAPPEEPAVELYSPFTSISNVVVDHDSFRPVLLTPPPTYHRFRRDGAKKQSTDDGIGLESQRFQQLLRASRERERNPSGGGLRKELALKIQKNKQAERRALFLSKLQAPPSPTATTTPKTPPDSPSVFHYTLPSPGLASPLTVFESVDKDSCESWVEKVFFEKQTTDHDSCPEKRKFGLRIPSLEQISARMIPSAISSSEDDSPSPAINTPSSHTRPLIGIGRLRMPLRLSQPQPPSILPPPLQPPKLRVTTVVESTADSIIPNTKLTETNLNAFNIRGQKAHDMLRALRKRTSSFATKPRFCDPVQENKFKRHSAPADMIAHPRIGFAHPVLALPGSF